MVETFETENKEILAPRQSKEFLEIEKTTAKEEQKTRTKKEINTLKSEIKRDKEKWENPLTSSETAAQAQEKEAVENIWKMCQKSYRKLPNKYKVSKKTITTQLQKETIDKQLIQKVTKYIDPETMEIEEFFRREATIQQYQDELRDTPFFEEYKKITMAMMIQSDIKNLEKDIDYTIKTVEYNNQLAGYAKWWPIFQRFIYPEEKKLPFDEEFDLYQKYLVNYGGYREIVRQKNTIKKIKDRQRDNNQGKNTAEKIAPEATNPKTKTSEKNMLKKEINQEKNQETLGDNDTQKDEQLIKTYDDLLEKCKQDIQNNIQETATQTIVATHINGLLSYFDISTLEGEQGRRYAEEMTISADNGYHIDYQDGIQILTIDTNIGKNIPIKIYYKFNAQDNQLAINTTTLLDNKNNILLNKTAPGTRITTTIPPIQDSYQKVQNMITQSYADMIKNANNIQDIQSTLQDKIPNLLFADFGKKNTTKKAIETHIEKNLTMATLQDIFFPPNIQEHIKLQSAISPSDTNIRTLLNMRNTTTEKIQEYEIRDMRRTMQKIKELIQKNHPSLGWWRNALFKKMKKETDKGNDYSPQRGESLIQFFEIMSDQNGIINFDDIDWLIETIERGENVEANLQEFSQNFQEKYETIQRETE